MTIELTDTARVLAAPNTSELGRRGHSAGSGVAAGLSGPVFVFPGQGAQWDGMAAELLDTSPAFASAMEHLAAVIDPMVDWSLMDVVRGAPDAPGLARVDVVQPALFAMYVSLAELWRESGVRPAAVIGHSQGEIAAAHVAGALTLEEAAGVAVKRSRLLREFAGAGGMGALVISAEKARALVKRWSGRLALAAINGPNSVVVSGEVEALNELLMQCFRDDVPARKVQVDYASHSGLMEPLAERVTGELAGIRPRSAVVPLFSTLTGAPIDTSELTAGYWYRNLRQTVLFEQAVLAALEHGHHLFVEVSPHPVLVDGITATIERAESVATAVATLRRARGGLAQFTHALAQVQAHGAEVDRDRLFDAA